MKTIEKKPGLLHGLKNAEHYDLFDSIYQEILPHKSKIPGLLVLWDKFDAAFKLEDEYYKVSQRLENTEDLVAANKQRNDVFMRLKKSVELELLGSNPVEVEAAQKIQFVIDVYKDIRRVAYTEESAMLTNIIEDLKKDDVLPYIKVFKLEPLVDTLYTTNESFKRLYRKRSIEIYKQRHEILYNARKMTDQSFFDLGDAIVSIYQANVIQNQDKTLRDLLENIIDDINSYIEQAERVYSRRVTSYRLMKNKEDGTPDDTTPDPYPHLRMEDFKAFGPGNPEFLGVCQHWSMKASDLARFTEIAVPIAQFATIKFPADEYKIEFPVERFLMADDKKTAIGLEIGVWKPNVWYYDPFEGTDIGPAMLMLNDGIIAVLDEVPYPLHMTWR